MFGEFVASSRVLAPLGHKVYSVVNYDKFSVDPEVEPEVEDDYFELVHHVQETYYLGVRRYTRGAFQRLRLANELERHDVAPRLQAGA